jgi:hypothetical protein
MRITGFLCLFLVSILAGCRSYGGHGSEQATRVELEIAVERFSARADRMRGDQRALADAAAENASLAVFAPRLARIIQAQEQTMARNLETVAALGASSNYRELHRAFGSILTEQQIVEDRYGRLLTEVQATVRSGLSKSPTSRYSLAPAFYARIEAELEHLPIRDTVR